MSRAQRCCGLRLLMAGLALVWLNCGEEEHLRPHAPDGGWGGGDADGWIYQQPDLSAVPDGLPTDPEGPTIVIASPASDEEVTDNLLKVEATVSDSSGVDPTSVTVTLERQEPQPMSVTGKTDAYEALVDLSERSGALYLWVTASDLQGHTNTLLRKFKRIAGPVVTYLAPASGGHYRGSALVRLLVTDEVPLTSVDVRVGENKLGLQRTVLSPTKTMYSGTLTFDDPFNPPLAGKLALTTIAVNAKQARTVAQRVFYVDSEGPLLKVVAPTSGQIVGNTVTLQVQVTDPAGVLENSVECVVSDGVGGRTVELTPSASTPGTYDGQFDSRTFSTADLWPVFSFRAADLLGNESHVDIQVGLDNAPPISELDPPTQLYMGRHVNGRLECSWPFDPVGDEAANDGDLVPQVIPLRAWIEDEGNEVPADTFVPVSLVDKASVWLYVLDDTSKPLLVDSDGDGECDNVNPEVLPLSSVPQSKRAIAVNLAAVTASGAANYTPWEGMFPFSECQLGTATAPPDPLCAVTTLTQTIFVTAEKGLSGIYTIPPAVKGDRWQCLGLPFDFGANEVSNGWTCVAVSAADKLGNKGVSRPLRLWVDKSARTRSTTLPGSAGSPPSCTGTLNAATGVVDANKPCRFRAWAEPFPQVFPGAELIVE